jgi:rhodanese-related sulfurtransferase
MSTAMSREELRAAMDDGGITVVDALPAAPYARRHLPGALNVVAEDSGEHVRTVLPDVDMPIVTYSTDERCTRGPELAARLRDLGYRRVRTYQGGIEHWIAAGLPIDGSDDDMGNSDAVSPDADADADGSETEWPPTAAVRLIPLPGGPYQVTGPLEIIDLDGEPIHAPTPTVYLCRCGRSQNKPFCDGSHGRTGWREDA